MTNQENESRITGYLLILIMTIIVGVLVYGIVTSKESSPDITFSPDASISPDALSTSSLPEETLIAASSPSPDASSSPGEVSPSPGAQPETPETSPDVSPQPSVEPSKAPVEKSSPKPSPVPSPTETRDDPGPAFEPPKPDGPPDMDRDQEDLFKGKKGKVEIIIFTKAHPFRTFLIDVEKNKYKKLTLKDLGKNRYQMIIPPGNYRLKIVKPKYFTFDEGFEVGDGDKAEISQDPIIKRPWLKVTSSPPGARIYIGERFAGVTPKLIDGLDDTTYTVKLTKKGYEPETLEVKLMKGKGVSKKVDLMKSL